MCIVFADLMRHRPRPNRTYLKVNTPNHPTTIHYPKLPNRTQLLAKRSQGSWV